MAFEEAAREGLRKTTKFVLDTEKKGSWLCTGRNLATLLPAVRWEVENIPNESGDLVKEISTQSDEGATQYFPVAKSKIWEEW